MGRLVEAGGFAGFAFFAFLASGCVWVRHIHNAVAIKHLPIPMGVPLVLQPVEPRTKFSSYIIPHRLAHSEFWQAESPVQGIDTEVCGLNHRAHIR